MKRKVHIALKYLLAGGTLGYGLLSALQAQRFADLTGLEEGEVKELALRDVASGIQILTSKNVTGPLMSRAIFDFTDAVKLVRRRPPLALVALVWALLAIVALFTQSAAAPEHEPAKVPAEVA